MFLHVEYVSWRDAGGIQRVIPDVLGGAVGAAAVGVQGYSGVGGRVRDGRRGHERGVGLADDVHSGHALLVLAAQRLLTVRDAHERLGRLRDPRM